MHTCSIKLQIPRDLARICRTVSRPPAATFREIIRNVQYNIFLASAVIGWTMTFAMVGTEIFRTASDQTSALIIINNNNNDNNDNN